MTSLNKMTTFTSASLSTVLSIQNVSISMSAFECDKIDVSKQRAQAVKVYTSLFHVSIVWLLMFIPT